LTAAVEKLQSKLPLEVPVVVGGKEVRLFFISLLFDMFRERSS
jgi:1-pyrroline-5-carboxylate dehydrogenase